MGDELRAEEINKLITWLQAKGFNSDDIINCIQYITNNPNITVNKDN